MKDGNKRAKSREGERGRGYRKHAIDQDREREAEEELMEGRIAWMGVVSDDHNLRTD